MERRKKVLASSVNKVITEEEYREKMYFSKGLAICETRILTDTLFCRFRDETFEFPSRSMIGQIMDYTQKNFVFGGYLHIKVSKLRKLSKEKRKNHGE